MNYISVPADKPLKRLKLFDDCFILILLKVSVLAPMPID